MRLRKGFTLVELLVVIGIIALLIGILLPALNKAREQSQKTKCLSNIRQLGLGLNMYASENRDCVPLGIVATVADDGVGVKASELQLGWSYMAYFHNPSNGNKRVTGLGKLTYMKLLKTAPLTYYCPKEDRPGLSFNTPENPWAYFNDPVTIGRYSYVGYWVRPVCAFPSVPENSPSDTPSLIEGFYTSATAKLPVGWPKYSKLKNKAILSDVARNPTDIRARHKTGISVFYANGGAKYVALGDFSRAGLGGTPDPRGGPPIGGKKWADEKDPELSWVSANGQGNPPTSFDANRVYLNSKPTAASQGVWNLLDAAP